MKLLLITILLAAGCASMGGKTDPTKIALAYYNQQRTHETLAISGVNELVMRGSNINVAVSNQLTPLSLYPRDPSALKTLLDGVGRIATVAGAAYVGNSLAEGLSRGPTVVNQPDPIVVQSAATAQ